MVSTAPGIDATDAELVEVVRQESGAMARAAFEMLVLRHESWVRSMLVGLCRNKAQADDLAQDTFLNAWLKLGTLREAGAFTGWLKQLAYREFLHARRRRQLEVRHLSESGDTAGPAGLHNRVEAFSEYGSLDPAEDIGLDEELTTLLQLCTPLEQELMVLCYGFEFTYAEISRARNMAVGTVKSHVHRAKQRMLHQLNATDSPSGVLEAGI